MKHLPALIDYVIFWLKYLLNLRVEVITNVFLLYFIYLPVYQLQVFSKADQLASPPSVCHRIVYQTIEVWYHVTPCNHFCSEFHSYFQEHVQNTEIFKVQISFSCLVETMLFLYWHLHEKKREIIVWQKNALITYCRPTCGIVTKRHRTITARWRQEDNYGNKSSSLFVAWGKQVRSSFSAYLRSLITSFVNHYLQLMLLKHASYNMWT